MLSGAAQISEKLEEKCDSLNSLNYCKKSRTRGFLVDVRLSVKDNHCMIEINVFIDL